MDPTGVIPMTGPEDGDIEDDYDDEDYEKSLVLLPTAKSWDNDFVRQ